MLVNVLTFMVGIVILHESSICIYDKLLCIITLLYMNKKERDHNWVEHEYRSHWSLLVVHNCLCAQTSFFLPFAFLICSCPLNSLILLYLFFAFRSNGKQVIGQSWQWRCRFCAVCLFSFQTAACFVCIVKYCLQLVFSQCIQMWSIASSSAQRHSCTDHVQAQVF